jgi:hypothetical protein
MRWLTGYDKRHAWIVPGVFKVIAQLCELIQKYLAVRDLVRRKTRPRTLQRYKRIALANRQFIEQEMLWPASNVC